MSASSDVIKSFTLKLKQDTYSNPKHGKRSKTASACPTKNNIHHGDISFDKNGGKKNEMEKKLDYNEGYQLAAASASASL